MSSWNQSSWSGYQWTAAEWEAWYAAINEAASVDLANGMGWAGPNPEAAADWSAGTAAVAEWSAGTAAVADLSAAAAAAGAEGPAANAAGAEQPAAAPDATPPDAGDAPPNSRPQLPEQNDAPSQQVDAPTQEAQPPAVAEAKAGAAVAPATVATHVEASQSSAGAASSSAVAAPAKAAPAHLLQATQQTAPVKPPPALGQGPPAGGKVLPAAKKAALPVKPAPVAGPAQAHATAPWVVVAQAPAPSAKPVLDEAYFAGYATFSDSCVQHNAAAKWLREYCARNSMLGVELPTHATVEVRDVVHDDHGPHFSFGEHKRQWHWHELIAQLDAESLAKLCGGMALAKCTFKIREGKNDKTPTNYNLWDFIITRADGSRFALHPEWRGLKIPAKDLDQREPPPPQSRPAGMRYCDQTKSAWAECRSKLGTLTLRFDREKNPRRVEAQAKRLPRGAEPMTVLAAAAAADN